MNIYNSVPSQLLCHFYNNFMYLYYDFVWLSRWLFMASQWLCVPSQSFVFPPDDFVCLHSNCTSQWLTVCLPSQLLVTSMILCVFMTVCLTTWISLIFTMTFCDLVMTLSALTNDTVCSLQWLLLMLTMTFCDLHNNFVYIYKDFCAFAIILCEPQQPSLPSQWLCVIFTMTQLNLHNDCVTFAVIYVPSQ